MESFAQKARDRCVTRNGDASETWWPLRELRTLVEFSGSAGVAAQDIRWAGIGGGSEQLVSHPFGSREGQGYNI